MNAERLDASFDQRMNLIFDFMGIEYDRVGAIARDERAVGLIPSLGKTLGDESNSAFAGELFESASRNSQNRKRSLVSRVDHSQGDFAIAPRLIVKRPMRFDIMNFPIHGIGDFDQSIDLIDDQITNRLAIDRTFTSAEVFTIGVTGMRADDDVPFGRGA